jgi:hypothetical protein
MSLSHDDNDSAASAASTDAMFDDDKWFDWDDGDGAFSANAPKVMMDKTGVLAKKTTAMTSMRVKGMMPLLLSMRMSRISLI